MCYKQVVNNDILMHLLKKENESSSTCSLSVMEETAMDEDETQNIHINERNTKDTVVDIESQVDSSIQKCQKCIKHNNKHKSSFQLSSPSCSICLVDYKVGDKIVYSHNEKCNHCFHLDCMIPWLMKKDRTSCPNCRCDFLNLNANENSFYRISYNKLFRGYNDDNGYDDNDDDDDDDDEEQS